MGASGLAISPKAAANHEIELCNHDPPQQIIAAADDSRPDLNPLTDTAKAITKRRTILVIVQLTIVPFMSSFSTGLITVAIPTMARDLSIPFSIYYWPLSVYGLSAGSCLLPAGSVADIIGSRRVYLTGVFLLSIFILASGLAQTGIQLIMFRAMQGLSISLTLSTSVSIITGNIPKGRLRNVSFACTGLGQPLGFSVGSVLGGVFVVTTGWRVGWHICAGIMFALFILGIWSLPTQHLAEPPSFRRIRTEVDWVGAGIASASLAMLAYALVEISSDVSGIRLPSVIALLALGLIFMPTFAFWQHFQFRRGEPMLIPNSLWKQLPFTTVCLMLLFSFACMQTMELYCSLFFQNVQHADALQASLQLLPSMILGAMLNISSGLLVDRVPVMWLTLIGSILCAGAPLLMALIDPEWPYWYAAFPAQLLAPLSADILFTIGLITISNVFPDNTQALAGAVFGTAGQFGTSLGLAIMGVVSQIVTQDSEYGDKESPEALEEGYRAGFWTAFAMMVTISFLSLGLRKVGRIGLKKD